MNSSRNCSNLVFLTTLACQLSECLPEDELILLSANLVVLVDMLAAIAAQEEFCQKNGEQRKYEVSAGSAGIITPSLNKLL